MELTLVMLAAGIGRRFQGGIKQLTPIGPNGELMADYALYDAWKAGFRRVVFVIRKELEPAFRQLIGDRVAKTWQVSYAYQELSALPAGFTSPSERTKPWGTVQALLVCRGLIETPFAVTNADDFYGADSFWQVAEFLRNPSNKDKGCMAGYVLKNTLSENGGVTRGVCATDGAGRLKTVTETYRIAPTPDGAASLGEDGVLTPVDPESLVSMNFWGFPASYLQDLEENFVAFLKEQGNSLTAELALPTAVDHQISTGAWEIQLLPTAGTWFGVTYAQDKPDAERAIRARIALGEYPETLP